MTDIYQPIRDRLAGRRVQLCFGAESTQPGWLSGLWLKCDLRRFSFVHESR